MSAEVRGTAPKSRMTRLRESVSLRVAAAPIVVGGFAIEAANATDASASTGMTPSQVMTMIKNAGPHFHNSTIHLISDSLTPGKLVEHGNHCNTNRPPEYKLFTANSSRFSYRTCFGDKGSTANGASGGSDIFAKSLNRIGANVIESIPSVSNDVYGDTVNAEASATSFIINYAEPSDLASGQRAPERIVGKAGHSPHVTEWYTA